MYILHNGIPTQPSSSSSASSYALSLSSQYIASAAAASSSLLSIFRNRNASENGGDGSCDDDIKGDPKHTDVQHATIGADDSKGTGTVRSLTSGAASLLPLSAASNMLQGVTDYRKATMQSIQSFDKWMRARTWTSRIRLWRGTLVMVFAVLLTLWTVYDMVQQTQVLRHAHQVYGVMNTAYIHEWTDYDSEGDKVTRYGLTIEYQYDVDGTLYQSSNVLPCRDSIHGYANSEIGLEELRKCVQPKTPQLLAELSPQLQNIMKAAEPIDTLHKLDDRSAESSSLSGAVVPVYISQHDPEAAFVLHNTHVCGVLQAVYGAFLCILVVFVTRKRATERKPFTLRHREFVSVAKMWLYPLVDDLELSQPAVVTLSLTVCILQLFVTYGQLVIYGEVYKRVYNAPLLASDDSWLGVKSLVSIAGGCAILPLLHAIRLVMRRRAVSRVQMYAVENPYLQRSAEFDPNMNDGTVANDQLGPTFYWADGKIHRADSRKAHERKLPEPSAYDNHLVAVVELHKRSVRGRLGATAAAALKFAAAAAAKLKQDSQDAATEQQDSDDEVIPLDALDTPVPATLRRRRGGNNNDDDHDDDHDHENPPTLSTGSFVLRPPNMVFSATAYSLYSYEDTDNDGATITRTDQTQLGVFFGEVTDITLAAADGDTSPEALANAAAAKYTTWVVKARLPIPVSAEHAPATTPADDPIRDDIPNQTIFWWLQVKLRSSKFTPPLQEICVEVR
jgi:hypothetical protein